MALPTKSLNDNSLMPYGAFEGTPMLLVPPKYLLNLFEKNKLDKKVKAYVQDNLLALLSEIKEIDLNKRKPTIIYNSLDGEEIEKIKTSTQDDDFRQNMINTKRC